MKDKSILIDQAQEEKHKLEFAILSLIQDFERKTGLWVRYIELQNILALGTPPSTVGVLTEVNL